MQKMQGMGGYLTEEAQIDLSVKSLLPSGVSFIQIRQGKALKGLEAALKYQDVWAWAQKNYVFHEDQRTLLAELRAFKSHNTGKIEAAAWFKYARAFEPPLNRLPERPSGAEVREWLWERIPAYIIHTLCKRGTENEAE